MGKLHIYTGAVWDDIQAQVYDGSQWVGKAEFKSDQGWTKLYPDFSVPLDVNVNTTGTTQEVSEIAQSACYAGVEFRTDGSEFLINATDGRSYLGEWLLVGTSPEVWVEFVRTGGATSWTSGHTPGTRYQLNIERDFYMRDDAPADQLSVFIDGYFRFWDAASGGSVLDTGTTGTWSALLAEEGCPSCCFTPDTLIAMADGSSKPIGHIRSGDLIRVQNGLEAVGAVIVRERRVMFKIKFECGRQMILSEDHPVYVDGKGYAAINPDPRVDYKDLGVAKTLEVGDYAVSDQGRLIRLTSMEPYDYPGKVYTLSNSGFFANGVLVY